jgi:hypothetical protein
MKAIIDRFEGETAVLTPAGGGRPFNLPKAALPADAAAGATVELIRGSWVLDAEDTEARRKRIAGKVRQLFKE